MCRRRRIASSGSIPACAGEPSFWTVKRRAWTVYPRVCGGTAGKLSYILRHRGLSPRVRGNRGELQVGGNHRGSIPACAGEPRWEICQTPAAPVYPRVCGGTARSGEDGAELPGLSPRVRGNQRDADGDQAGRRSIPACAGEPRGYPLNLMLA